MKQSSSISAVRIVGTALVFGLAANVFTPARALAPPAGKDRGGKQVRRSGPKRGKSRIKVKANHGAPAVKAKVKAGRSAKRPGSARPVVVRGRTRLAPRTVHSHRYWHPLHNVESRPKLWLTLGYAYHPGGTPYVREPDRPAVSVNVNIGGHADADHYDHTIYTELQELTQLVYEWRMFNESPALHAHIGDDDGPWAVVSIRAGNQEFDVAVRAAMRRLAAGHSARVHLAHARSHLEQLFTDAREFDQPRRRGVHVEVNVR